MRKMLMTLVLTAAATSAWTSAAVADDVLAEKMVTGGKRPAGAPQSNGVRILASGQIVIFETPASGEERTFEVGSLAAVALDKLKTNVKGLKESALKLANPNQRTCADAPDIAWFAYSPSGTQIKLGAVRQCREFNRADGVESPLVSILNGFDALGDL